ncbi:UNVERIFIED_CONTAM: hypothetical protein NCL1_14483 [Trichonephila clavipes]
MFSFCCGNASALFEITYGNSKQRCLKSFIEIQSIFVAFYLSFDSLNGQQTENTINHTPKEKNILREPIHKALFCQYHV